AVSLDRRDHGLLHLPRRHLEPHVVGERRVPGQRVVAPGRPVRTGGDVVAGAEAPALGSQHDHTGGRVPIGLVQALDERRFQLVADGIEFFRTVERDDADTAVDGIRDEVRGHGALLPDGIISEIRFRPPAYVYSTRSAIAAISMTPSPPTGRSSTL